MDIRWSVGAYAGNWTKHGSYCDGALFIGGSAENPDELDPSVVTHEFMHHVTHCMSGWTTGGPHSYVGYSRPPLAYNEGLASALGQQALGDPLYLDAANGGRNQVDLENRWTEGEKPSDPQQPLHVDSTGKTAKGTEHNQMTDNVNEFLVAAVLWDLMDPLGDPIFELHDQVDSSYSARLGSFSRAVPDDDRADRGAPGPDFVDFLDGWRCLSPNVSDDKLKDLLAERAFPYDLPKGLCRH